MTPKFSLGDITTLIDVQWAGQDLGYIYKVDYKEEYYEYILELSDGEPIHTNHNYSWGNRDPLEEIYTNVFRVL